MICLTEEDVSPIMEVSPSRDYLPEVEFHPTLEPLREEENAQSTSCSPSEERRDETILPQQEEEQTPASQQGEGNDLINNRTLPQQEEEQTFASQIGERSVSTCTTPSPSRGVEEEPRVIPEPQQEEEERPETTSEPQQKEGGKAGLLSKKGFWRPPMPFTEAWQLAIEEVDQDLPPWERNSMRLERYYIHLGGPWEFPDRGWNPKQQ
jgi:hypothetical protein